MFLGVASSGVMWLAFTLDYIGHKWRRSRDFFLISVIPLITLALVWTNEWHGLFWSKIYLFPGNFGDILVYEHGFWFWLYWSYQDVIILSGIVIL